MNEETAVCGLICEGCDMKEATNNPELAKEIAEWFRTELNEVVSPEDVRCEGCHGSREKHWSPDCWILLCCVDKKGLEYCSECDSFPCEKLAEWAAENERYGEALERLKAR